MSLMETNWAKVLDGRCWNDNTLLVPSDDGWLRCSDCGRAFLFEGEAVAERIPVPESVRGKAGGHHPDARFVLESGEVVQSDGIHFPAAAVAVESRWSLSSVSA
jgi:hypothetical protein